MNLQTDPDVKPTKLGVADVLQRALKLVEVFEQEGMTDKSSEGVNLTKSLVNACQLLLGGERKATRLYLHNLLRVPARSRGPLFRAAVRMAAQRREFLYGRCPEVSGTSSVDHWAGAYILGTRDFYNEETRRHRMAIKFVVVTGPLAGTIFESVFSRGFAFVLRGEIAANLRGKWSKLDEAHNLLSLNFCQAAIFLTQKKSLVVGRVSATSSMKTHNRKLVRSRFRAISDCPFGARWDCVHCSATTRDCPRAIRISQE